MSYSQLTSEERYVIYHLKLYGLSLRDIARRLGPQLRLELIRLECLFLADPDPGNHFLATINPDSDLRNEISRRLGKRFNSEFRIPE